MKNKMFYLIISLLLLNFTHNEIIAQKTTAEFKKLTNDADIILTGKVLQQSSAWNEDKTRIHTSVTIEVEEILKGSSGEKTISVTHPGGEVGEVGELYTHMPTFKDEEEVLLFVKRDQRDNQMKVLQGDEGKITLFRDKITGEKVTSQNKKVSILKEEIKNYMLQK